MSEYKKSIYNILISKRHNSYFVWNSKSGAIVQFNKNIYNYINMESFDNSEIKPIIPALLQQGFIVEKQNDEFNAICFTSKQMQISVLEKKLSLVIAPTMACNFRCKYCFEDSVLNKRVMSKAIMEAIIKFISNQFEHRTSIELLEIQWFGGEPLLAYESVILPLLCDISHLCEKFNVKLVSTLTTNGYFLTKDRIEYLLQNYRFESIQMTFDGTLEEYCTRKQTSSESYFRAKSNLLELSKYIQTKLLKKNIYIK